MAEWSNSRASRFMITSSKNFTRSRGKMLAIVAFNKLLQGQVQVSETIIPGGSGEMENVLRGMVELIISRGGGIEDWFSQYRIIAMDVLKRRAGINWGRMVAVMLFTIEFKSVTNLDDESLLIWFENILSEMGLKEFDIPEHVFKHPVWSKSNWLLMAVTHVLLVFVYLIQTI